MERRQGGRLVSHAEVEQFLRRFGYAPERVDDLLRELPDPVDFDEAQEFLAKNGITSHGLMDRMGSSP